MNRIKELREQHNISQSDLARKIGVVRSAMHHYENGLREPSNETLTALANYFDVSTDYLLGRTDEQRPINYMDYDNIMPITKQRIPMLGEIACGKPIFCNEDRESYVDTGTNIRADFCLKCKGDSMTGARIEDGDIVFIRRQNMVNNGEIAAVIINNEATLKRVYFTPEKSKLVLQAENPKYEPLVYIGVELNEIIILGKAIAFQSNVK